LGLHFDLFIISIYPCGIGFLSLIYQFVKLFERSVHESYDNLHKQIMLILNRNNFNSECLLLQQDIFMKYVKVPQKREDLIMPKFINHPITDMAKEMVLKDIRKLSKNKHEAIIDE